MRKFFYPKLAADTMKKNRRIYFPYIMTCILTVMMYYIISSLKSNPSLANIYGGTIIQEMMNLGSGIMSVFAVIFLFYTNSFLMKQRKREFGLYNILGMEKRHIARIIFYETLYILCISLLLGFVLGILLDKLMFLLLLNIFRVDVTLGFYVSPQAFGHTIRLFAVLFGLLLLNSLRQIYRSSPLELLKSRSVGEKPPRSKWLLTLVGFLFLGTGYYMSITIEDPVTALALFFVAVLLVILGTYCLFIAGGVTLLKALQKNKRYYYKTRHFIALSGMIYRMKQNAAGLANICILSTMVMVMVSSTVSMYASIDSQVAVMLPRDMTMTLRANDETDIRTALEEVRTVFEEKGLETEHELDFTYLPFTAFQEGDTFTTENLSTANTNYFCDISVLTLDDYNRLQGTSETLDPDEVLTFEMSDSNETFAYDTATFLGQTFSVKKIVPAFEGLDVSHNNNIYPACYFVVKDMDTLQKLAVSEMGGTDPAYPNLRYIYMTDVTGDDATLLEAYQELDAYSYTWTKLLNFRCRPSLMESYLSMYGGLLFLGIFLGTLFLLMTVLIIYYKQISEGYDDRSRFEIMQKVGVSHGEIKSSIHSQVLTVFFLPLIAAGIHTAFAFPMTSRMLKALSMNQTDLFILCLIITFVVFTIFYIIVYMLTARTYYKIVSSK